MTFEVKLDEINQLIHARFNADSTIEDWKNALEIVMKLYGETNIYHVLVDVRKQTDLAGTFDLFEFASNLPHSMVFAVLCDLQLDEHRFIETVATNRGITVKDFDSEQDAIDWLNKLPDKK